MSSNSATAANYSSVSYLYEIIEQSYEIINRSGIRGKHTHRCKL